MLLSYIRVQPLDLNFCNLLNWVVVFSGQETMNNNCNYYGLLQNCELVVGNDKIRKMFSVLNQYFMVILPYFVPKCYDIFIFCPENPEDTSLKAMLLSMEKKKEIDTFHWYQTFQTFTWEEIWKNPHYMYNCNTSQQPDCDTFTEHQATSLFQQKEFKKEYLLEVT